MVNRDVNVLTLESKTLSGKVSVRMKVVNNQGHYLHLDGGVHPVLAT